MSGCNGDFRVKNSLTQDAIDLYVNGNGTIDNAGIQKLESHFLYDGIEKAKQITQDLTIEQKKEIEEDVLEILGERDDDLPVVLDLETINILEPGKYELDLVDIFKGKPLIYRLEEGKYIIDIASSFLAKNFDEKDLDKKKDEDKE